MKSLLAKLLVLLLPLPALADSWPLPVVREVFSASRDYFVRVLPGESSVAKGQRPASAEFYRRAPDRSYRFVTAVALPHPAAPVDFFVADSGHLATVDNWRGTGYGTVVAIFDAAGKPVRRYALKDLFPVAEIDKMPHSVSSIHWRSGPAYVRQDQATLLLTVRSGADFLFGLESGRFVYCETQAETYRCRGSDAPARWQPRQAVEVTR